MKVLMWSALSKTENFWKFLSETLLKIKIVYTIKQIEFMEPLSMLNMLY